MDCSGEFALDRRWRARTYIFPEFCFVLEYEAGKGKEISQVYADRESLRLEERMFSQNLTPQESVRGIVDSRKVEFVHDNHTLWYPLHVAFAPNSKKIRMQQNELQVSCTGDPQPAELKSIEDICAKANARVAFYPTQKRGEEWYKDGPYHVISSPLAPEFDLIATWEGSNFDCPAIDLYGPLRKALARSHRETIETYAGKLIQRHLPKDEGVAITNETL